jgi:hypothetical protein
MNEKGVIGVLPIISQPQASFTEIHNIDGRTTNRISIMSYRSFELPDLVSYSKVRREEVWIKEAMVDRNAISLSWTSELWNWLTQWKHFFVSWLPLASL